LGLANYIAKGENISNRFGNVVQPQSTAGLFGNQTATPSFFNQNNQQMSNISLANQAPQHPAHSFGALNSYNQPVLPSSFCSQTNSPVASPNFTGNNFQQQNNLPTLHSQFYPNNN
jgi:hypothetical protein